MISRGIPSNKSLWHILLLALLLAFAANGAWAQEDAEDEEEATTEEEEAADLDKVVVTGSRLQRETYTSISPLQIITAEGSREAGLVDAAQIMQQSTATAGQQIDLTFNGFVLDNGPGASTVDLRGLGANRTLVLLNSRRLAPSGVEGAPSAPDLNLIPSGLVQRYEVLLDGASSIYGSDAVAGVTNIIMRKDFDGLEVDAFYNQPDHDNGESYNLNAVYGLNFDRGMFGIGVEYYEADEVRLGDRPWTAGCDQHHEIDENGQIRSQDEYWGNTYDMDWDECRLATLDSTVTVYGPGLWGGLLHSTPGYSTGGFPNFSNIRMNFGPPEWRWGVDGNGDGVTDFSLQEYDLNGKPRYEESTLWPDQERISLMAYGEYVFEGEMNNTVFFEFNYNDRDFSADGGPAQLWPRVPATNPYNICNPDAEGGVDCGLAENELLTNPSFVNQFIEHFTDYCAQFGVPPEFCTPENVLGLNPAYGPVVTEPVVYVNGDRNSVSTNMQQYRGVVGFKGDLPFVDWGSMSNWVYDAALSYTTSEGESSRPGVRGDRLEMALGWYSSTGTPCHNDLGFSAAPKFFGRPVFADTMSGCVPVNMYAPSLYGLGQTLGYGDFATAAERDYVFDTRDFTTDYTQTLFTAYANGFLFELPGGTALGGIGVEWREDDIESIPDDVAREGQLWGFFADGGATGTKWTRELFGEIELPILAGRVGVEELTMNLSGRYTDDEFYGSDTTYSFKLGYRPVQSLLLRFTHGTSFRAPNVREVFLQDQTGFQFVADPCVIPNEARDLNGNYVPEADTREDYVLQNCFNSGVDPTALDDGPSSVGTYSVEIARGGTPDLLAETSASTTWGFAFEQPWFEAFDMTFGMTWYDIDIDDTIVEPTSQFLVNDCYNDPQLDSTFCDNLERDQLGFLDLINARYINRDNAQNRGVDINANYDQNFNIGSQALRLGVDLLVNRNSEASTTFVDDDGDTNYEDLSGNIYYPQWKAQLAFRLNVEDFRFTWVTNYIGETSQHPDYVDDWSDVNQSARGDTCFGPPNDVYCRDYADTDEYWLHSASVYWYGDSFTVGAGIRNVFDEEPPFVDSNEYLAINRVPLGLGYDLFGRTYFVNVVWRPGFGK
jgi:iron complex outermembrane receptor protein